jgi:predicted kinase
MQSDNPMQADTRRPTKKALLVIVSGAPATGKTTLAPLLAERLSLPMLAKDWLRQLLRDAFDANTREENQNLLAPGFRIYYGLISELLTAGIGVVAECNFHRGISEPELAPVAQLGTPVIVHCQTNRELSIKRFVERDAQKLPSRRYAFDRKRIAALQAGIPQDAWDRAEPVEIDAPVLRVDTTDGYVPTLDEIVAFIRKIER